jgi:hypothetical protein
MKGADMTTKQSKPKQTRRGKSPKADDGETTVLRMSETATAEEAKATIADSIPGWNELSEREQTELAQMAVAYRDARLPPKVKLVAKPNGGKRLEIDGPCETMGILRLQNLFGAPSMDSVNARANELLNYLGSINADNSDRYNAALSFIESMGPQNQAEVLLLIQMYVTHDAAIRALSQLGKSEWVPTTQMFGNLAAKLLRTSQGQMETLARMRRGGEQVVRHIHVDNRGGQAVIAENVNTGGSGNGKIDNQSHATGAAGIGPALLGADAFGNGVPIPCREGPEAVPNARGHEPGRA